MTDINMWLHQLPSILMQARTSHKEPKPEEGDERDPEELMKVLVAETLSSVHTVNVHPSKGSLSDRTQLLSSLQINRDASTSTDTDRHISGKKYLHLTQGKHWK